MTFLVVVDGGKRKLKVDKTKEKGSQHDPEHVVDKEETFVSGGS